MQDGALSGQPFLPTDLDVLTQREAALFFAFTAGAALQARLDIVGELANDDLCVNGIVEEAEFRIWSGIR